MPHFKYFIALLLIAGCASQDHASRSKSENSCSSTPTVGFAFDWDDNIFYMPTNIQIRHKENKEDIQLLSTGQFAVHRKDIAKTGAYKNYEIYDESFIYFGDDPKKEKIF